MIDPRLQRRSDRYRNLKVIKNTRLAGSHRREMLADIFYVADGKPKAIIIFSHGFKGFKDWGAFNKAGEFFALHGFVFVKFNFSHNGTTPEQPDQFADLEAFGKNTFSMELDDLGTVIDWITGNTTVPEEEKDIDRLYLIGHSRGGGISILKAAEDERVKKLVTWAAVSAFGKSWKEDLVREWKEAGVIYSENSRTRQMMPLYYSLYEDFQANNERLDIEKAVKRMKIPFLLIHGTQDPSVSMEQALELKRWNQNIKLDLIPNAGHTFSVKHPFKDAVLPFDFQIVLEHTEQFLVNEKIRDAGPEGLTK